MTDLASMITPGGAAAKVDRAAAALERAGNAVRNTAEHLPGTATDAAKAAEKSAATPVHPPDVAPPAKAPEPLPGRTGELPPPAAPKSPEGAPAAASAAEPKSAPAHIPAPASPTEARAPVDAPRHAAPADISGSQVAAASAGKPPLDGLNVAAPTSGALGAASESIGGMVPSTSGALSSAGGHLGPMAENFGAGGGHSVGQVSAGLGEAADRAPGSVGAHEGGGVHEAGGRHGGSDAGGPPASGDGSMSGRAEHNRADGAYDDGVGEQGGGNGQPDGDLLPHVPGLTDEIRDAILSMEKGSRPDPSEYLPHEYITEHLEKFRDGVARFMPEGNFDKYGIAQSDGTSFVISKSDADAMLQAGAGNPRVLERTLGLPEGFLDESKVVRIDIAHPDKYDLRIPSGNEAGANSQWLPGGLLPDGMPEAVIDGIKVPRDEVIVQRLDEELINGN